MARRVFFSFHYQNDIWRVNQVRMAGEFRDVEGYETVYDNSLWEKTKKSGDAALRTLIQGGLDNSSVTVALSASQTWGRKWVRYELLKSLERGSGLMTLWIHQQRDQNGQTAAQGYNPMACIYYTISTDGRTAATQYYDGTAWQPYETISTQKMSAAAKQRGSGYLSDLAGNYVWSSADPVAFARWVEAAAKAAGR